MGIFAVICQSIKLNVLAKILYSHAVLMGGSRGKGCNPLPPFACQITLKLVNNFVSSFCFNVMNIKHVQSHVCFQKSPNYTHKLTKNPGLMIYYYKGKSIS